MIKTVNRYVGLVAASMVLSGQAAAQQPTGWTPLIDGLAVFQSDADLSGGGSFSANRQFLRGGALYRNPEGASFGVLLSYGQLSYDFAVPAAAPWGDVRDIRLSAPIRFSAGGNANVFIAPSLRWDYEDDASMSDGFTYGVFAGVSWRVSESLKIGPAFGVFSGLGNDDFEAFPALLVDWDISSRWNLSTGTGLGASQGPGVSLSFQANDKTKVSFVTRSERTRFRLDNSGIAPGGVGEDSSIPVVLSVEYKPNPAMSFSAFAGAEFDGRLELESTTGATVSSQTYETAPIAGLSFRVVF
ncbi:hypothetical protein [Shimia sp.]|uniref:hypothetical protein n=1 Tax=Shimia sp. TaxID=1954381 RepID=UPI00329692F5